MRASIRKLGNSAGLILPKSVLTEMKVGVGDPVELKLSGEKLTIERVRRHRREGWEEDARRIAAEEPLDSEWLDLPNESDDKLVW